MNNPAAPPSGSPHKQGENNSPLPVHREGRGGVNLLTLIILVFLLLITACGEDDSGDSTDVPVITSTPAPLPTSAAPSPTFIPTATRQAATATTAPRPSATAGPVACEDDMDFVADITIPDGTVVNPGVPFTKTWQVRNSGTCTWGTGYRFVQIEGSTITANPASIAVPETAPGLTAALTMTLTVREGTTIGRATRARFQMRNADGELFGQRPFVEVVPAVAVDSTGCTDDMDFVADVTIPDGTRVVPGVPFTKTWRIANAGTCTWTGNYRFSKISGGLITASPDAIAVPVIAPGEELDISVVLVVAPGATIGESLRARFQMTAPDGTRFGQQPYVEVIAARTAGDSDSDADECENDLDFIADVTIPDGTTVSPGLPVTKIWRVRNSGTCTWNSGYRFVKISGEEIVPTRESITVPIVAPGDTIELSVTITVIPEAPLGQAVSARFQMESPEGDRFGQTPYVEVIPVE